MALVHLVSLERGPDEDRDDELPLLTRDLREWKHRSRAGALSARADEDDDRIAAEQRLDFVARFIQRLECDRRIVPGAETARRATADEEPLLLRQIRQRELVRVQEPCRHRAPEPLGIPRVAALRHAQIAPECRLDRSKNVSTATARAQKEDMHVTPDCFERVLN